jgi:2-methylcitrate dehydratase PrpD
VSNSTPVPVAEAWAAWCSATAASPLPGVVEKAAGRLLLDTVGVLAAGAQEEATQSVLRFAHGEAGGSPLPAASVAFVLGTAAHAIDFDSTHFPSMVHASGVIVPAVLAVADSDTSPDRAMAAVALGHEVAVRVGMAGVVDDGESGTSTVLFDRGFHPTPMPSIVGAAAAAGVLLGLSDGELAHALAIACSLASGVLEANRVGGTIKGAHSGWAAAGGVRAALLAKSGLTGPATAIEGRFGLVHAFMGVDVDPTELVGDLGDRWAMEEIGLKAYPTNGFTHPSIDAAAELRERGVQPDEVESIRLGVATPSLRTIAEPWESKLRPATAYAARFSGPFVFARAFLGGTALGVGLNDITEASLGNPEILALVDRTTLVGDPVADEQYPRAIGCRATVTARTGAVTEVFVPTALGTVDRPLTDDQLDLKVDDCLSTMTDGHARDRLRTAITTIQDGAVSHELVAAVRELVVQPTTP